MPYQSSPPPEEDKMRYQSAYLFISALRNEPRFEIRLGRLRKIGRKYEQKGVDVQIAIDLVRLSMGKLIDKAIIVSGDSDLVPSVRIAKENMVITELVYHPASYSRHLYEICDERYELTQEFIDSLSP